MLEGKDLILRALEPADIDFLFEWENNEKLWHLSNTIAPFSRFVLEQYILNSHRDIYTNKQLRLMIDIKNEDANNPIGSIDLFDFDPINKRAGIGVLITEENRNKGYASEALEMLIEYCFSKLQELVSERTGYAMGEYYHFAHNLHIYNDQLPEQNTLTSRARTYG